MKPIDCYRWYNLTGGCGKFRSRLLRSPKGYISKKTIGGKPYLYLQNRNGDTVESKYIKAEEYQDKKNQLSLRKEYEAELPEISKRLADIETA